MTRQGKSRRERAVHMPTLDWCVIVIVCTQVMHQAATLLPLVEDRSNLLSDHNDAVEVGRPVGFGEAAQ